MDALTGFDIRITRPDVPDVADLLARHFALMRAQTPEESCHVLPADALASPDITLMALRREGEALAVGAIRVTGAEGEIKSMHTAANARGQGAARALLAALEAHARACGVRKLNLETGSGPEHAAARALYERAGFTQCGPFGNYSADPLSIFMTRAL